MLLVCCVGCLCAVLFCNAMQDGKSLQISVTMPSIEVGTVGGGTHLPAQSGCLDICNTKGAAKVCVVTVTLTALALCFYCFMGMFVLCLCMHLPIVRLVGSQLPSWRQFSSLGTDCWWCCPCW